MKKNRLKQLLYLLSLTSMLTLNGCNSSNNKNSKIEIKLENQDCHHLNEKKLENITLSDGTKYIKSADIMSAIRYNLLNKNNLLDNVSYDEGAFDNILTENKYYNLIDSPEVRKSIAINYNLFTKIFEKEKYNMLDACTYEEDIISNNVHFSSGTDLYTKYYDINTEFDYNMTIDTNLSTSDKTKESVTYENIFISKSSEILKKKDDYNVEQSYNYVTVDKQDLNKIQFVLTQEYTLNEEEILSGNYSCKNYKGTLTLDNIDEKITIELNEELFDYLLTKMIKSAKDEKTTQEFLEENEEIISNLYDDEYQLFVEKTKSIKYTLTK